MKRILSYISVVFLTFIFVYIFPVYEVYILFYMLLLIPFFDAITFIYFQKPIEMEVSVSDLEIEKGDDVEYRVIFKNRGFLPVPFIDYEISYSENLENEWINFQRISISPRKTIVEVLKFKGIHVSEGYLNLNEIKLLSIFGLFRGEFKFNGNNKIVIKPKCYGVEGIEKYIENTFSIEDEDNCSEYIYTGEAGHEYKEYTPGDPLNRVNWKLSSKENNKLIIRKSITELRSNKTIIVDPLVIKNEDFYNNLDLLFEGTISIINEFISDDYEVSVLYKDKGRWLEKKINSSYEIEELQKLLSRINIVWDSNSNRFNGLPAFLNTENNVIIMSTNNDNDIKRLIKEIKNVNEAISIVSNLRDNIIENQYYLSEDYRLIGVK